MKLSLKTPFFMCIMFFIVIVLSALSGTEDASEYEKLKKEFERAESGIKKEIMDIFLEGKLTARLKTKGVLSKKTHAVSTRIKRCRRSFPEI